jgi:hypothetical protein
LTIKAEHEIYRVSAQSGLEENAFVISAWSEVTREVKLNNCYHNSFIPNQELAEGVMVQRTISSKSNSLVTFINTNFHDVTIQNLTLKFENLDNYEYNIFRIKNESFVRTTRLINQLNINDCPPSAERDLIYLCKEFSDVFALNSDKLTHNNFYQQTLRTTDNNPVYIKNYRIPQAQKAEINSQVEKMLENDIIESSISRYNSPVLLVPKKSVNGDKNGD